MTSSEKEEGERFTPDSQLLSDEESSSDPKRSKQTSRSRRTFSKENVIVQEDYSISYLKEWDDQCSSLPYEQYFSCYDRLYDQQWKIQETWASDHSSFSYMIQDHSTHHFLTRPCSGIFIT